MIAAFCIITATHSGGIHFACTGRLSLFAALTNDSGCHCPMALTNHIAAHQLVSHPLSSSSPLVLLSGRGIAAESRSSTNMVTRILASNHERLSDHGTAIIFLARLFQLLSEKISTSTGKSMFRVFRSWIKDPILVSSIGIPY